MFELKLKSHIININPNIAKDGGLQSPDVKGEAVVAYRDSLTTQDLKSSDFPAGETTWQNRPHPLILHLGISRKESYCCDFGHDFGLLVILCHVVDATMG